MRVHFGRTEAETGSVRTYTLDTDKCQDAWSPHSDGVDVAGVSAEGLLAGPFPQVPQLGQRVTGSRDEGVAVGRQGQRHAVSNVVGEHGFLLASLQVPQAAAEREKG